MNKPRDRAVILLSGGLDSTTTLAIAKSQSLDCYALTFGYGQRHSLELRSARRVAKYLGASDHVIINLNLGVFGGSALTSDMPVPMSRTFREITEGIPVTYVPARNTIFLSIALAWAETIPADNIFIGVSAMDATGYPDCRLEFLQAFEKLANIGTRAPLLGHRRFKVLAPLVHMTKAEVIQAGLRMGVDYSMTHTCYSPTKDKLSCGKCDACRIRLRGFEKAGCTDPLRYADDT